MKRYAVVAFLACFILPGISRGDANPAGIATDAKDALDRALSMRLDSIDRYSCHLDTEMEIRHPLHANNPVAKETYSADIRVAGERFDILSTSWILKRNDSAPSPSYRYRSIWDGKTFVSSQQFLGKGTRQIQLRASAQPVVRQRSLIEYSNAPFVRGIVTGDDKSCLKIMRDSASARIVGDENVAGHRCILIEATTKYGKYQVWLDPEKGYQPRRMVASRHVGDEVFGKELPLKAGKAAWIGQDCDVHDVRLEKVGDAFVATNAVLDRTDHYDIGDEVVRQLARLSHVEVNPDFEVLHAFVMSDVPDGSPVWMQDKNDNMPYIWRKGAIVLDTNDDAVAATDTAIGKERRSATQASSPGNSHK